MKVMAVVSGRVVVVVKKGECRSGSHMMKIWKDSGGWSAGGGVGEIAVVAAAVVVVATVPFKKSNCSDRGVVVVMAVVEWGW